MGRSGILEVESLSDSTVEIRVIADVWQAQQVIGGYDGYLVDLTEIAGIYGMDMTNGGTWGQALVEFVTSAN